MGYTFDGCFSRDTPGLAERMRARWPHARVRTISRPFQGIGLRLPWEIDNETTAELVYGFRDELLSWSPTFPEVMFVFVCADCFGGHCEYEGYLCQNGRKLAEEPLDPDALERLFAGIGIELPASGFFEPFTRTYKWD